jgi:hypothetical protein
LWAHDAVGRNSSGRLDLTDSRLGRRAEDPVDGDVLAVRAKQMLERPHRMVPRAPANHGPRQDRLTHVLSFRRAAAAAPQVRDESLRLARSLSTIQVCFQTVRPDIVGA